jgi:ABC-type multidrug transport system ATPase subunit
MEEAEVCCQRFAIMSNGCLCTIGSLKDLRQSYGAGYKLFINGDGQAECFVEGLLTQGYRKTKGVESTTKYEFELMPGSLADIFQVLSQNPEIKEWKLTQTSLEDIFMNVAGRTIGSGRHYEQETIINDTALNKEEEFVQAL